MQEPSSNYAYGRGVIGKCFNFLFTMYRTSKTAILGLNPRRISVSDLKWNPPHPVLTDQRPQKVRDKCSKTRRLEMMLPSTVNRVKGRLGQEAKKVLHKGGYKTN